MRRPISWAGVGAVVAVGLWAGAGRGVETRAPDPAAADRVNAIDRPAKFVDPRARVAPTEPLATMPRQGPRGPEATVAPIAPDDLRAESASPAPAARDPGDAAHRRLESARARYDAAVAAYAKALERNYPVGPARHAIVEERNAAEAELHAARAALEPPAPAPTFP
jgi:hypothetical protein